MLVVDALISAADDPETTASAMAATYETVAAIEGSGAFIGSIDGIAVTVAAAVEE